MTSHEPAMTTEESAPTVEPWREEAPDRMGAVASTVCAAHCAIGALLPAAFGALGAGFLMSEKVEWLFTLVAIAFAAVALWLGYRKHRSRVVAVLLAAGIVGMLGARLIEEASGHHHDGGGHAAHAEHHEGHDDHGGDHGHESENGEGHAERASTRTARTLRARWSGCSLAPCSSRAT